MERSFCATLCSNMLHVGTIIRALRVEKKLTLPQLADEAGVNSKTISQIERGEVDCTGSILGAIAHALGYPSSASLEARLDEWCEQRIGPRQMKADWLEVITLWDALAVAPEAQHAVLTFLRREVRLLSGRSRDQGSTAGRHQRAGRRPLTALHRETAHGSQQQEEETTSATSTTLQSTETMTPTTNREEKLGGVKG